MLYYLALAAIAFGVTFVATPLVRRLAFAVGAVDVPDARKVHRGVMPRLGGLAIFLGFLAGVGWLSAGFAEIGAALLGGVIVVLTGALDDRFGLSPLVKLIGQMLAAAVVIAAGIRMEFIHLPFAAEKTLEFGLLAVPITLFWIVGVTNAINLIDGLDGLAAGVTAIAAATMFVLSLQLGNVPAALMAAALVGSLAAFLIFNFHPAKIFMGDSGSLFLGYMMAVMALLGFKQVALTSFIVPLLVLAVPLSDTLFAIVRRMLNGQSIAAPDKRHLHHALLAVGLSHRQAVLAIYGLSAFFGLSAILFSRATVWIEAAVLVAAGFVLVVLADVLELVHRSFHPIRRMLRLPPHPERSRGR
ncbi:MraY family glycosyltransferase [Hydrogenibacillus schlegelii]|uniref:UDP-phosphate N-acetylglucosaminyl 1-phosphate transferase n=1 Tax=Hydrogenibacillus schlegelii TaxID=1484 RepID=A0A132NDI9_HYDSH|nr:MraY family glycosyltransferase [Hydrogenibacillus schlegelii]KWX08219.1 UDP-phosphate N-acetylglucosaminyl 1-phosphate transferase [Hydrogenibacillus schlegelii]OAR03783.1 UDP-phosphate N-acetylglucosaminyl 1-phosphate transferase [Hydrogenibacillus schlegelii]PTQ54616.1 MAG: Undecaprenyl-phosphate N-acetylglucosaminyl 1-phosphate transferase [Hydrogenibacillus schlegelii]